METAVIQNSFHDKPHILVVDDDDRLRALLKKFLGEQGFMVTSAASAAEARRKMEWFAFDLMVLDVMMPEETGLELLSSLPPSRTMPILMLSAMGEADDRVAGLEVGADDYLVKPFEPKELVLRIRALLRRHQALQEKTRSVRFGEFVFDLSRSQLRRNDALVALTSSEAAILKLLAEHAGAPVSREQLSGLMPGGASERSVDVQITRLRKKIEESERKPVYLQTVRGAGYVLYVS
jgi:two-component system phosphate regulon response regulator OmpR